MQVSASPFPSPGSLRSRAFSPLPSRLRLPFTHLPAPLCARLSWGHGAGRTLNLITGEPMRDMTIKEFRERLAGYPGDTLCCGTIWFSEDFLALNENLTPDEIGAAMEVAEDFHDASSGFNWAHLLWAISEVTGEEEMP